MNIPAPWTALILAAASYRFWRLLAEDEILDRPRRWIVGLPTTWREGMLLPDGYRNDLAAFINCPWCFGFWISLIVWASWQVNEKWVTIVCFPFALSAAVGITRNKLDPPDE